MAIVTGRNQAPLNYFWVLLVPLLVTVVGFYLVPLGKVFLLSVTEPVVGLGNYHSILTSNGQMRVMMTTLRISAITTVFAIVMGYCVALALATIGPLHRKLLLAAVLVSVWISVLVRAFAWLMLLRDSGPINQGLIYLGLIDRPLTLVRNEIGVTIGMIHYLLPYAILPIYSVMQGIDQRVLRASRSLGASTLRTFWRIYLPLTLPGVLAATIVVFVFALGFYVTPALLGGGRVIMLAESMSISILTTARWGFGSAQAIILLVTTMALIAVMNKTVGLKRGFG